MKLKGEMTRIELALFDDDASAAGAAKACREAGHEVIDVFGPWPIHGIDASLGLRASRLTWACFWFGMSGLLGALALQYGTNAFDWPLDVGGKPLDSLPAFIPIVFELTVLIGGLGVVASLFARCGLFPGRRVHIPDPAVTDDQFCVVTRPRPAAATQRSVADVWRDWGAVRTWEEIRS